MQTLSTKANMAYRCEEHGNCDSPWTTSEINYNADIVTYMEIFFNFYKFINLVFHTTAL